MRSKRDDKRENEKLIDLINQYSGSHGAESAGVPFNRPNVYTPLIQMYRAALGSIIAEKGEHRVGILQEEKRSVLNVCIGLLQIFLTKPIAATPVNKVSHHVASTILYYSAKLHSVGNITRDKMETLVEWKLNINRGMSTGTRKKYTDQLLNNTSDCLSEDAQDVLERAPKIGG